MPDTTAPATPSISINSPPTSSRPSLDSTVVSRLSLDRDSISRGSISPAPRARRNRSALREFYGIKRRDADGEEENELDREGFDAEVYVRGLLGREGLAGLLKVENGLVNDIRGFDGERKSLVYDNYNKLITATDTIKSMRSNMDPLTPTTSTLPPAIAHIATVSASLVRKEKKMGKRETVEWCLRAPERMKEMTREDGERELTAVLGIVERWKGVNEGEIDGFRSRGEEVLKGLT